MLGVDSSPELLHKAFHLQNEAQDVEAKKVEFLMEDGQELGTLEIEDEFDAVFSNAALHWMKRDPEGVARGAFACLKKGGRFVAEVCLVLVWGLGGRTLMDVWLDGGAYEYDWCEECAESGAERERD